MRRPVFLLGVAALVMVGGAALSGPASSHGRHTGFRECIGFRGSVLHVTNPTKMEVDQVNGPGNVVIQVDGNPTWNPAEWRSITDTVLSGWPNGWGGYETAVYTIRTTDPQTWAWVHYDHDPYKL